MVGVWIEPVIAQLMMILFAMSVAYLYRRSLSAVMDVHRDQWRRQGLLSIAA